MYRRCGDRVPRLDLADTIWCRRLRLPRFPPVDRDEREDHPHVAPAGRSCSTPDRESSMMEAGIDLRAPASDSPDHVHAVPLSRVTIVDTWRCIRSSGKDV